MLHVRLGSLLCSLSRCNKEMEKVYLASVREAERNLESGQELGRGWIVWRLSDHRKSLDFICSGKGKI